MIPGIRWSLAIRWSPAIRWSIRSMDFDKPKVYGDTSITDGLVLFEKKSFWRLPNISLPAYYRKYTGGVCGNLRDGFGDYCAHPEAEKGTCCHHCSCSLQGIVGKSCLRDRAVNQWRASEVFSIFNFAQNSRPVKMCNIAIQWKYFWTSKFTKENHKYCFSWNNYGALWRGVRSNAQLSCIGMVWYI